MTPTLNNAPARPVSAGGGGRSGRGGHALYSAHGKRRISFVPQPSGYRFYHTHNRQAPTFPPASTVAKSDMSISSPARAGNYDREIFLVLKIRRVSAVAETWPGCSGPATKVRALEETEVDDESIVGERYAARYEVGYASSRSMAACSVMRTITREAR
jgi:hypothetical protein